MGKLEDAIELLQESLEGIDAAHEARLSAAARYNLLCCLDEAGRHQEAWSLLPEVRDLFRDARPLDRVRLDALPPDGAWLRPTRSLRDFVSSWTARRNG